MNKKTLLIIAVVIILILAGLGAYLFFKKTPMNPTPGGLFPEEGGKATGKTGTGEGDGEGSNIPFTPASDSKLPRLYELHKTPVAGSGFIESGKDSEIVVFARYIERGLGHIYETPLNTLFESRISNETRSRLSEAVWGNGGKSVVIRSFNEAEGFIKTRILNISISISSFTGGTSTAQTGDFIQTEEILLPDYIPFLATAEDGADKIFYLENGNFSSVGLITNSRGVSAGIFNSTFTEWLPQFPNQNLVTLNTKPSASVFGYFFFLDTKTKAFTKILGGINGLTTLTSRDGKLVLFSETKNGAPELSVYNVANKETLPLFIQTLPEKCAWSVLEPTIVYCAVPQSLTTAEYPDQWYQGIVSFSDNLWRIDTVTSATEKIYDLPSLDVINPSLSSNDSYFLFMNKVTGTPWVFRMSDEDYFSPQTIDTTVRNVTPAVTTETVVKTITPAPTRVTDGMVKIR